MKVLSWYAVLSQIIILVDLFWYKFAVWNMSKDNQFGEYNSLILYDYQ